MNALFTSRVKIDDESPYLTLFAARDRLLERVDGDQRGRRAEDLLLRDPHLRVDVGEDGRAVVEALAVDALAAGQQLRALALADLGVRVDLLDRRLVDHGADVGVVLPRRADPQLLGARDELLLQLLVDAALHDHARRRGAALAGRAERRPDDAVDREVDVGVVHDDDRVLAAELEVDVLQLVGRVLRDEHAGLARAGERDHRHVGVAHERVARLLAEAVHDLHDALGQAGLVQQVDEALREQRRVLGRLQHDGVAADERGRELPRRDRDREVPRRDRADDADRHADAHHELVAELRRGRLAEQAPALAAHVVAHVDRFLDVAAGLRLDLPHLAGHQVGELRLVALEQLREAEEDVAALGRRHEAPVLPGGASPSATARSTSAAVERGNVLDHLAGRGVQ